jgi:hypothetical protein
MARIVILLFQGQIPSVYPHFHLFCLSVDVLILCIFNHIHTDFELANQSKMCVFPPPALQKLLPTFRKFLQNFFPCLKQRLMQIYWDPPSEHLNIFKKKKILLLPGIEPWTVYSSYWLSYLCSHNSWCGSGKYVNHILRHITQNIHPENLVVGIPYYNSRDPA